MRDRLRDRTERRDQARHSERDIFITWVLWVIGMSETKIASVVGKRRKQVAGIVARSPYPNRGAMSDAERAAALTQLLRARNDDAGAPIDGGLLDRIAHKIIPLQGRQRRKPVR